MSSDEPLKISRLTLIAAAACEMSRTVTVGGVIVGRPWGSERFWRESIDVTTLNDETRDSLDGTYYKWAFAVGGVIVEQSEDDEDLNAL